MIRQKADIVEADLHQLLPAGIVPVFFQHELLLLFILPVDIAEDLRDKLMRVLKVLIGRRAGHPALLRHAPGRKAPDPISVEFLHASQNELLPRGQRRLLFHHFPLLKLTFFSILRIFPSRVNPFFGTKTA